MQRWHHNIRCYVQVLSGNTKTVSVKMFQFFLSGRKQRTQTFTLFRGKKRINTNSILFGSYEHLYRITSYKQASHFCSDWLYRIIQTAKLGFWPISAGLYTEVKRPSVMSVTLSLYLTSGMLVYPWFSQVWSWLLHWGEETSVCKAQGRGYAALLQEAN